MSQSQESKADAAQQRSEETRSFVRTVKAATRRRYTPEEKILVVLEGFRREVTVNDLCRREGIKPHSYHAWTKEFMEAGKERLTRETVRTPRARRSSNSGVTTTSSSNWWPTCPWRSTVSKKRLPQCLPTTSVPTHERVREDDGPGQGRFVHASKASRTQGPGCPQEHLLSVADARATVPRA